MLRIFFIIIFYLFIYLFFHLGKVLGVFYGFKVWLFSLCYYWPCYNKTLLSIVWPYFGGNRQLRWDSSVPRDIYCHSQFVRTHKADSRTKAMVTCQLCGYVVGNKGGCHSSPEKNVTFSHGSSNLNFLPVGSPYKWCILSFISQYDIVLSPDDAKMHQWAMSTLVQLMAWHLFGAKPLPEPMLTNRQLHP